jgi:hypothetical protein
MVPERADHEAGRARVEAHHLDQRDVQQLRELAREHREHVGRRGPVGHRGGDPPQRSLFLGEA